jgi:fibronectin type 3 domain-containing protein
MGNRTKAYILIAIIILAISTFCVTGCTSSSGTPVSSYEELLKIIPPPPLNLSGTFKGDHIELCWDTPETVNFHHVYSDVITGYIIYKGTNVNIESYLATTAQLTFKDSAISGSPQYAYEVTAVHQGGTESVPSQEIIVRTSVKIPSRGEVK